MKLEHIGKCSRLLHAFPAHLHSDWELIWNIQGSGTMIIDEVSHRFQPGTIVLCPPGAVHSKASDDGFEDYYLRISGLNLPRKVFVLEDDCDGRIGKLIQVLHSIWYEPGQESICDSLFGAIIGLLRPVLDSPPRNKYVQLLRSQIIAGFTDPDFQLQDALKTIPTNHDHLRRQFKKDLNQTPHGYLTALRLEHARQLLTREDITVAEAAYRSGFYDPLYFSRLFRRHTGIAPSKWR